MSIYYEPQTDEGLYAELMRFHRAEDAELDDLYWGPHPLEDDYEMSE